MGSPPSAEGRYNSSATPTLGGYRNVYKLQCTPPRTFPLPCLSALIAFWSVTQTKRPQLEKASGAVRSNNNLNGDRPSESFGSHSATTPNLRKGREGHAVCNSMSCSRHGLEILTDAQTGRTETMRMKCAARACSSRSFIQSESAWILLVPPTHSL